MSATRRSAINKFSGKVHNADAAFTAKAQIRRNVLEHIGAEQACIFDAFGGPGAMYGEVWRYAGRGYVGCDKELYQDERLMFCADSARVMRAIELAGFNIFDFDSFGSPYEQIIILTARRKVAPGEQIGLIITDGTELQMKMNAFPHAVGLLAGLRPGQVGVAGNADFIFERVLAGIARNMNCTIVRRWQVSNRGKAKGGGNSGILMRYVGLVLRGRGDDKKEASAV